MVSENFISYHAGLSKWGKYKNLNPISLGIEIVNSGFSENSWEPFYPAQIRIVGLILARMVDQYNVLPNYVVGHADIAPHRKYVKTQIQQIYSLDFTALKKILFFVVTNYFP